MADLQTKGHFKISKRNFIPFRYNQINLKKIVSNKNRCDNNEVSRNVPQKNKFLNEVKDIIKNNIILIFDECSSGFRETWRYKY